MAGSIPVMVAKGIQQWLDDHPEYRLTLGIPGISARFVHKENKTYEEVTYEGLVAYYKQSQEKGKRKKNEA